MANVEEHVNATAENGLSRLDLVGASAGASVEFDSRPHFISNSKTTGDNLLSVLRRQFADLGENDTFDFCVAFVSEGGLTCLVQMLSELKARGIKGRLLTSTYLNFNSPDVYRKLLTYDNIETRVYQQNLHAKGYMFNRSGLNTVIVGSSNLTDRALTCNQEWNVLFRSYGADGAVGDLKREFELLWNCSETAPLTETWISHYREYISTAMALRPKGKAAFSDGSTIAVLGENEASSKKIKPNKMQEKALEALAALHERRDPRALLVSATGTGKTYLSAFDVKAAAPVRVLFLAHRKRILTASMASYKKLLGDNYTYGLYRAGGDGTEFTCTFAMCSTICGYLDKIDAELFDYIVIDEAHRVGAKGYQRILEHFKPKFCLGMTATPNRTDGYDVFALFNHVIAYQITLQDALREDMLAPFHYFGIADLAIDEEEQSDFTLFSKLTSEARVNHIIDKIEEYSVKKDGRKGLVFCSRLEEARELAKQFTQRGYESEAIDGSDSDAERDEVIRKLESGELEYIFSVNILNEGVDIPAVNQIIMLRRTESSIVFVQQLGRGLRKADNKESTLVLDFIGNYQQNFLIPVALSGDKTYNKDRLRAIVKEGSTVIPGASTVSFDRVSEGRIYQAIDQGDFTAARFLKDEYLGLRQMLGAIPSLLDFDRNGSIDPLLIFNKYDSYHGFLSRYEKAYDVTFSEAQENILKFVSKKLANGKRADELYLLRALLARDGAFAVVDGGKQPSTESPVGTRVAALKSATNVLNGGFSSPNWFVSLVEEGADGILRWTDAARASLLDPEFRRQLNEVVEFGIHRHEELYAQTYRDTSFVLNAKYTYEEVCRLLGWDRSETPQNIGGYMYNEKTNTFPVFINYDKAPDISDTIKYEDRFVSDSELIGISKKRRTLASKDIQRLMAWPGNGMKIYLFVRKNTNDKGSKEFYFLGQMHPTGHFVQTMTIANENAVEIGYQLETPVRSDIYEYITSVFVEGDEA